MSIFSEVGPIKYEGPDSTNPLAYKVYDKDRVVLGKKLGEWLRLTVAYWHSFSSYGSDMFGGGLPSSAGSSGVAERNLNRITIGVAVVWSLVIVGLGLVQRWS